MDILDVFVSNRFSIKLAGETDSTLDAQAEPHRIAVIAAGPAAPHVTVHFFDIDRGQALYSKLLTPAKAELLFARLRGSGTPAAERS